MDEVAVSEVNDALDKVREEIEHLEERTIQMNKIGEETARHQAGWARTQIAYDGEHERIYEQAVAVLSKDTENHGLELRQLAAADEENTRQMDADRKELSEIQEATLELRQRLATLPDEKQEVENAVMSAKSKLEHRLNKLERVGRKTDRELEKLSSTISRYERALGLIIDVSGEQDDMLDFRFTNIDPRDVAKEYRVSVQRDSAEPSRYRAVGCSPSFANFEALATTFNDKQDMHGFMRNVRIGFRETCNAI